jgi:small-conductance mechanosensitive channel
MMRRIFTGKNMLRLGAVFLGGILVLSALTSYGSHMLHEQLIAHLNALEDKVLPAALNLVAGLLILVVAWLFDLDVNHLSRKYLIDKGFADAGLRIVLRGTRILYWVLVITAVFIIVAPAELIEKAAVSGGLFAVAVSVLGVCAKDFVLNIVSSLCLHLTGKCASGDYVMVHGVEHGAGTLKIGTLHSEIEQADGRNTVIPNALLWNREVTVGRPPEGEKEKEPIAVVRYGGEGTAEVARGE